MTEGNGNEVPPPAKKGLRNWLAAAVAAIAAIAVVVGNIDSIIESQLGAWVASWFRDPPAPGQLAVTLTCQPRQLTVQLTNSGDEPVRLVGSPTFERLLDGSWESFPMSLIYLHQGRDPFAGAAPLAAHETRPVPIEHPFEAFFTAEEAASGRCKFRVAVPNSGTTGPAKDDCTCES